jgi:hypothetical protein
MQNEGRRPLKGVVYTTRRRVTKFGNVLSGRDGKIKPRKLATTHNLQNPTSDEPPYCMVPLRRANGESSVGRLKTFLWTTLLCTGQKKGADFQGRGLAGKDVLWFPTFSAGE